MTGALPESRAQPSGSAPRPGETPPGWPPVPPWRAGRRRQHRRRQHWYRGLAILAALQAALGLLAQRSHPDLPYGALLLLIAGPALLALLFRRAGAAVAAVSAVTLAYLVVGGPVLPVAPTLLIAVIAAVVHQHRYVAWSGLAGLWLGWMTAGALGWRPYESPVAELIGLGLAALPALVAEILDNRRQRVLAYQKLWQEEQRRRAEEQQRLAGEERLRIARELHDVLAHSLSLITVRASVALELIDTDPGEVRTALQAIKDVSKDGLTEVRTVLAGLRTGPDDQPGSRRPAPNLDRLDDLIADADAAGLAVEAVRTGQVRRLPAAVGLAGYRIVQEALTNVIRHSQARTAQVHLHYGEQLILIGVADDGPAGPSGNRATAGGDASAREAGGGNGLLGVRERASALGGTACAGTRPDGGYQVLVQLPVGQPGPARQARLGIDAS